MQTVDAWETIRFMDFFSRDQQEKITQLRNGLDEPWTLSHGNSSPIAEITVNFDAQISIYQQ